MTSQAARQRVMGSQLLSATTEAALSSQLAVSLLAGDGDTRAALGQRQQPAGGERLRPSSFDAVRLATRSAAQQPPQRVPDLLPLHVHPPTHSGSLKDNFII